MTTVDHDTIRQAVTDQAAAFTPQEAADRLAFANAALALAGHEITDPYLNEVAQRFARGEITVEEANELGRHHIRGQ